MHKPLLVLKVECVVTDRSCTHAVVLRIEVLVERVPGIVVSWTGIVPLVALGHLSSPEAVVSLWHGELRFVHHSRASN